RLGHDYASSTCPTSDMSDNHAIELYAGEPHAAAPGAIVDLDAAAFRHRQIHFLADRALHGWGVRGRARFTDRYRAFPSASSRSLDRKSTRLHSRHWKISFSY